MIIDYKTHHVHNNETQQELASLFSFQMNCYALALTKAFDLPAIRSTILFTNGPSTHCFEHSNESLLAFENELKILHENIQRACTEQSFELTTNPTNCTHCPYYADNTCGVKG